LNRCENTDKYRDKLGLGFILILNVVAVGYGELVALGELVILKGLVAIEIS